MCIPQSRSSLLGIPLPIELVSEARQQLLFEPGFVTLTKPRKPRLKAGDISIAQTDGPKGRPVKTLDLVKEQQTIAAAKNAVMRAFRVHHRLLDHHCKKPEAVIPRQILFYLLYHVGAIPQRRIAAVALDDTWEKFTVTNSIRMVRDVMTVDDRYRAKVLKAMRIMLGDLKRSL